jgi:hypothetical protein
MAQREINNKTIRHYCQPGKLIYYIFNFQRGSSEGYSQTFPVPRLVVFFWGPNFRIYCFLGVHNFGGFFFWVLEILVLLWGNFDKNAYFDIFFAYLKPKFGTRNCMRSYFLGVHFFNRHFFGCVWKLCYFLGVKFIFCNEPRYRKFHVFFVCVFFFCIFQ